jgi:hypothetical protein
MSDASLTSVPTFDDLWPTVAPITLLHRYKAQLVYDAILASPPLGAGVECGIFRGGITIMMAKVLRTTGRRVRAYDSFEGLPNERATVETEHYRPGHMIHSEGAVRATLEQHGVAGDIDIVAGWFNKTMTGKCPVPISCIHIDCDMYYGVRDCLNHLYDSLVPGGIIVFDDYFDQGGGVEAAVNEHVKRTHELIRAGYGDQVFIVKGQTGNDNIKVFLSKPRPSQFVAIDLDGLVIDVTIPAMNKRYRQELLDGKLTSELPGGTLENAERVANRILRQCRLHRMIEERGKEII